jgi:Fe-S-cluster containining protein
MIDCTICKRHCCGMIPDLIPVLLPDEVSKYPEKDREFKWGLWILKQKEDICIFKGSSGCSIYEQRPLECQLYPYLIDLDNLGVKLDDRYCPQYTEYKNDNLIIYAKNIIEKLPLEWVEAYKKAPING